MPELRTPVKTSTGGSGSKIREIQTPYLINRFLKILREGSLRSEVSHQPVRNHADPRN